MRAQITNNKNISFYFCRAILVISSIVWLHSVAAFAQSAADQHYQLLQQAEKQRQQLLTHAVGSDGSMTGDATNATAAQRQAAAQRDAVFDSILQKTLPMTPSQIERLHRMYDKTQQAAATPPRIPPSPTSTTQAVDLSPGAVPPVIRLSQGFVTSMVFVDSSGAPWPIKSYGLGNPKAFNIQWDENNTLMVQAMNPYTVGNLAVKLDKQPIPVMLTLIPGQPVVDYRVDLRISGYGPNAKSENLQANSGLPAGADPALLNVLDGVPPTGSRMIKVSGGDAQAWRLGDKVYLRTHYNVLSPAWISKMSSTDGTNAYAMLVVPIILVERSGKTTQLRLEALHDGE